MNKAKYIDIDKILPQLVLYKYTPEFVRTVFETVNLYGVNEAARIHGVSKTTIRWWRTPGRNAVNMQKYNDKEADKLKKRERYKTDYDKILQQHKKYQNKRYHSDPNFRLRCLMRTRVWRTIKDQKGEKMLKLAEYIGCSMPELRKHFESKFTTEMSWDNYGSWHIDHIKACSNFDLTNVDGQKACFHYSNLQPLWATDNLIKSNK